MTQRRTSKRKYSDRTLKILWGRAAGRCAVHTCRVELLVDATDYDPIVVIGDIAHIEAASDSGPRANPQKVKRQRDEYDNLILLCKNCHARLDGQKHTNTVEMLRQLRNDHEAWVRSSLPERGLTTIGWQQVVLQGRHLVDINLTSAALSPGFVLAEPAIITADSNLQSWDAIYEVLEKRVDALFADGDPFNCRFAVFPLAPVSACIALGYLLTNRPNVRLFQYQRDERSWIWPRDCPALGEVTTIGLPQAPSDDEADLAFCFHVSTNITDEAVAGTKLGFARVIHISVDRPGTEWLCSESQLGQISKVTRQAFEACINHYPKPSRWHIFCAAPAPVAVAIGQQISPTMYPPIHLYEFTRSAGATYQPTIVLGRK